MVNIVSKNRFVKNRLGEMGVNLIWDIVYNVLFFLTLPLIEGVWGSK